jgi:hypothetical protein
LACEARLLDKWGLEYPTSGPLFLTPFLNYRISKEEFLPLGTEAEDHTTTVRNYSVSFPELSRHTDFPPPSRPALYFTGVITGVVMGQGGSRPYSCTYYRKCYLKKLLYYAKNSCKSKWSINANVSLYIHSFLFTLLKP